MPLTPTTTQQSQISSLIVETGANESNSRMPQDILKPMLHVPDDTEYTMDRWHRQTPQEEPWTISGGGNSTGSVAKGTAK
ncbi:hypothetical protein LTR78_009273 [Recurvomyces mirabilis]|uniref:Uncharacterized protein n=1 Tax=Recurvomyces mirabilis TaxID=574656 RepID=A0AAE0TNZ4_9PEZI|nr:hypothetical protein LTR78_009273 [Recurvomyces mirabilis]KAK5156166.1 hypothetical protein LTS14_005053 [Recurvomyces mirabilis]